MKPYFNFNRKEKIGVVALSALILLFTVILNVGYSTHVPDPLDVDESKLDFLVLDDEIGDDRKNQYPETHFDEVRSEVAIVDFDPNEIDLEKWMSFGFSEKQAASIVKYRESYGPFEKKEDIKKLYVVSDEKYAELEPHIKISQPKQMPVENTANTDVESFDRASKIIELNTATKAELMSINGIGEYYADRVLAYRTKIGGFVDPEQIHEMSIREEGKITLLERTIIDAAQVHKTNINHATKDQLRNIPYSNWLTVATILKYRDENKITNLDFLTETEISLKDKAKFELYIDF